MAQDRTHYRMLDRKEIERRIRQVEARQVTAFTMKAAMQDMYQLQELHAALNGEQ